MSDVSGVLTPIAMSAVINGISKFQSHGPAGAFQVVFANLALFTMLASVGQFIDWKIAQAFAIIYLIASFLTAGAPFIEWAAKLAGGTGSAPTKQKG